MEYLILLSVMLGCLSVGIGHGAGVYDDYTILQKIGSLIACCIFGLFVGPYMLGTSLGVIAANTEKDG